MVLAFGNIFSAGNGFRHVGASVTQPIFQGGTLLHKERAAKAACVQVDEQYRSTVLIAFQNVADTLHALEQDADGLKAAVAAKVTLTLTTQQMRVGYVSCLALSSAEQLYQQAVISLVQAQSRSYADTAAVFQALGGGWWNCPGRLEFGGRSDSEFSPVTVVQAACVFHSQMLLSLLCDQSTLDLAHLTKLGIE